MSFRTGFLSGIAVSLAIVGVGAAAWWIVISKPIDTKPPSTAPQPASVAKIIKEADLNTIVLTATAEKQLAIRTEPLEVRPMKQVRVYGGEVTIPAGQTIIVSAPLMGTLKAPTDGVAQPGGTVKKGQPILQLRPLLTPEGKANLAAMHIEAEGQVKNAETNRDATKLALDRALKLVKDGAGSQRTVDEAQAQFDLAVKTLEAVTARRDLLNRVVGEIGTGTAAPISIDAPADGLLRSMNALPNQTVPAGATLFEVADLSKVWLRVPVYVGDAPDLDTAAAATVSHLSARPSPAVWTAKVVVAPPSANVAAGSVDLFYELDNRDTHFSPGQRVAVSLPLKNGGDSLVAPWAAVIHDVNGGTWVYEQTGERTYARRRVEVRYVLDGLAVLKSGPAAGTKVVTDGAAELFGTEVGFSK